MARQLRIEYPGALYHVMSRGNANQDIFLNDNDHQAFLNNLKSCIETYHLICHAYCLMDNHYHLLLETPDGNLSASMHDINGVYSQKFNERHHRHGHVLQGRYKAYVIEKDVYLLAVARYIVLNPVRAGIVNHPKQWKWSNYNATSGDAYTPKWLQIDWTLGLFSNKRAEAKKQYRQYVIAGVDVRSPYDEVQEGVILGSPQFVSWIWEKTNGSEVVKEIPTYERMVGRPTLEELFDGINDLADRDRMICVARGRCGYRITEIAAHLGLDPSTVGKIARGRYHEK